MSIQVLFFGATADIAGSNRIELANFDDKPISEIRERLVSDFPKLGRRSLLLSLNQQYSVGDEIVRSGDEIAIFTAVSGG